jgi:succinyl-diaminopimelate desuccinylase
VIEAVYDWAIDNTGERLGVVGADEITTLTSNLGVAVTQPGITLALVFSVRYPVTWNGNNVRDRIAAAAKDRGFFLSDWRDSEPLYVPQDDPLVATLMDVYRRETGDMQPPKSMGGGTYARTLKKGVAFGPNFPGFPDNAHQADEYWTVEDLIRSARIYAKALARLGSLG